MKMTKASVEILEDLHNVTTEALLQVIRKGIPVMIDGEPLLDKFGEVVRAPAPAAYIANAIKLLKDNGIEAVAQQGSPLGDLKDHLPMFEDGEDESDLPDHPQLN